MKETIHANIGTEAFTIDKDAYDELQSYLADIRSRLPEEDTETLSDIEVRMAEIFREKIGHTTMRVVTIETARETMQQMGAPADFGECRTSVEQEPAPARRLYRSRSERSIAGICGGLARFAGADVTLIRLVTLLLILFGGLSIWVYIILWIVVPEEPAPITASNTKK